MEKVSVIIPCYNGEKYVDICFNSMLNQDYGNVEIIVVDDGSQDNSAEKIKNWTDKINSKGWILTYVYQENKGLGAAINTGLKYVNGDYLSLLDIDDRFLPGSIRKRAEFLTQNSQYAGVKTNGWMIRDENKSLFVNEETEKEIVDLFDALIRGKTNNWAGSYMVRTSILFDFYPDREIYPSRFGQNLQIILPVAYQRKFGYIDEPLMEYIIHDESLSQTKNNKFEKDEINAAGYLDIYNHLIHRIVKESNLKHNYLNIAQANYLRNSLDRAMQYQRYDLLNDRYKQLRKTGLCNLNDRINYYSIKMPIISIFLRCIRKIKSIL